MAIALAIALAGCGSSAPERAGVDTVCEPAISSPPCDGGVEEGAAYPFRLLTHCGVEWAYFDGRYWVPKMAVDTPPYWDGITDGKMTLVSPNAAVFRSGPTEIRFVPAPDAYQPPPCA